MRVALVHYWLVGMAGGEKVLESLCRLYPDADIFTHALDRTAISPTIAAHDITTTFIDRLPRSNKYYKKYLPLMPLALEQLDLTPYDLVISSESGPAKGVVTRSDALHVCYCHTPMRYLWDHWRDYFDNAGLASRLGMRLFLPYLRRYDVTSAFRVDHFVANSRTVAARIHKHWRRDAAVVYPPVDVTHFQPRTAADSEDYYLCLGRLIRYKRTDLAVEACTQLDRPLIVIGAGEEDSRLRALAGPKIRFLGRQDDATVKHYLARCRALLFPGEEDFGIVPVEAAASGVPVIAFGRGGATETVCDSVTGLFFREQSVDALREAILAFEGMEGHFVPTILAQHAAQFSEERFQEQFKAEVVQAQAKLEQRLRGGQYAP